MTTISLEPFAKEARQVNDAIEAAVQTIEHYANNDTIHNDDTADKEMSSSSDWEDPEKIQQELQEARDAVQTAWEALGAKVQNALGGKKKETSNSVDEENIALDEQRLKVAYLDMITDAFGDVLDTIRQQEGDDLDIDVLVDCLQSGLELLTMDEKVWLLRDDGQEEDEEEENDTEDLTPHERRRRQLGYHTLTMDMAT